MPAQFELDELDYALRGKLLRMAFGKNMSPAQFARKTREEIEQAIDSGMLNFSVRDEGKFIKDSFVPLPPSRS